jgi:hypothetical protein
MDSSCGWEHRSRGGHHQGPFADRKRGGRKLALASDGATVAIEEIARAEKINPSYVTGC